MTKSQLLKPVQATDKGPRLSKIKDFQNSNVHM